MKIWVPCVSPEGINNKVVVITGASSGLGEAAARHLSRHGAKLVLIEPLDGKTVDWMEKVSNEPYQAGFRAEYQKTRVYCL